MARCTTMGTKMRPFPTPAVTLPMGPCAEESTSRLRAAPACLLSCGGPARLRAAGTTSSAIISQVDLLATLAEVVGAPLPNGAGPDSRALPKVLTGQSEDGRSYVVQQGTGKLALRREQWKYVPSGSYPDWAFARHNAPESPIATPKPPADQALLFNLAKDPGESENVIDTHPEVARKMAVLLDSLRIQAARK